MFVFWGLSYLDLGFCKFRIFLGEKERKEENWINLDGFGASEGSRGQKKPLAGVVLVLVI